jgi:cell division transport system permease protein
MASPKRFLAAVGIVAVILLGAWLLGGALTFSSLMEKTVASWERMVEVEAFLEDGITAEQLEKLERTIKAMPQVRGITYTSKEAALEEFKELNKESPAITENVEAEALPASYRITLKDPKHAKTVANGIGGLKGVDDVDVGGEDVANLLNLSRFVRIAVLLSVIGIAVLGVGFIIGRTRLAIA